METLELNGAIIVSETTSPSPKAGTIRWTGTDFEGYNGRVWVSLTYRPPVPMQYVRVTNAGNANDPGGTTNGAVAYEYGIGRYEVTNAEYVQFLNAVDTEGTNALALYSPSMSSSGHGGINFDAGAPRGFKYVVKAGFGIKPVVYVSFYDAMRFCNWLHNGGQPGADTEDGAYTLLGGAATPTNWLTVTRNPGAKVVIPTEDEWYKAAYHQPRGLGGDADDYWDYPTRSNTAPTAEPPPGGDNSANYWPAVRTVTDVGAYPGSASYYGTFDQGGNVWEWNETILGSSRVLRGGAGGAGVDFLKSSVRSYVGLAGGGLALGLRVASP